MEEQFDKEKAKAEVLALDSTLNNDKTAPNTPLSAMTGVNLKFTENKHYEAEMAKLYKEMDDKVTHFYTFALGDKVGQALKGIYCHGLQVVEIKYVEL